MADVKNKTEHLNMKNFKATRLKLRYRRIFDATAKI